MRRELNLLRLVLSHRRAFLVLIGLDLGAIVYPTVLPAQQLVPTVVSPWDSSPIINVADVDSTVPPCHDFYQFATGNWYRRTPATEKLELFEGVDLHRIGDILRQFVVTAPTLAKTTLDPSTRLVGNFYGSCFADTTGTLPGAVGDTARARYCLRMTLDSLELAVLSVLLERVWPVPARALSRTLWTNMAEATGQRFRSSKALTDSTRQWLLGQVSTLHLKMSVGHSVPDIAVLPFLDSLATGWDQLPAAQRGYRDLVLSPTDFQRNLIRVRNAAPSAVAAAQRETLRRFLAMLLAPKALQNMREGHVFIAPRKLIPPRVSGLVDLGGWYGTVTPLVGHEISHWFDQFFQGKPARLQDREVLAFVEEQFKGQMELQSRGSDHPFNDLFGASIGYQAFEQALKGQSRQRLEGFTPEQRFFIGLAQKGRGGAVSGNTLDNTPTRWRVLTNGALSTMPAFARAFDCKPGQPMTGGHVWYRDPWYGVALPGEHRRALYRGFWEDQYYNSVIHPLAFFRVNLKLTTTQQATVQQQSATYVAQQTALLDSLAADTGVSYSAGNGRILRLLAQHYGEYRTSLTPEQQALFDRMAQAWLREQQWAGFTVTISGVQP